MSASTLSVPADQVLYAYSRYLHQLGSPLPDEAMARALADYPQLAEQAAEIFKVGFDPQLDQSPEQRRQAQASLAADFTAECIRLTLQHPEEDPRRGVNFEEAIPYLLKRMKA